MAFGGLGGNENITLKILLETAAASGDAKKFFEDFQKEAKNTAKVNGELNKAIKQAGTEALAAGRIVTTSYDGVAKSASGAIGKITELNSAIQLGALAGNALSSAFSSLPALLDRAVNVEGITGGFKALQEAAGEYGDNTLARLRTNTKGYVSDVELMQKANQALLLGLPNDKFVALTKDAIKLGDAMGITAAQAVESLTLGIGRQSKLILDNLGIIVNTEKAYQDFADANGLLASELNDAQKQLAFQEAAFDAIEKRARSLPEPIQNATSAYEKFNAALENQKNAAAAAVGQSEPLRKGIEAVTDALNSGFLRDIAVGSAAVAGFGLQAAAAAAQFTSLSNILQLIKLGPNAYLITKSLEEQAAAAEKLRNAKLAELYKPINSAVKAVGDTFDQVKNRVVNAYTAIQTGLVEGKKVTDDLAKSVTGPRLEVFSKAEADDITKRIASIYEAQKKGAIDSEQFVSQLNEVRLSVVKLGKDGGKSLKDFENIAKKAFKDTEDTIRKNARESRKSISELEKETERAKREFERFAKSIDESFEIAVPQRFVDLLNKAFIENAGNAKSAAEAIKQIGLEAQKAGVDLTSLLKVQQEIFEPPKEKKPKKPKKPEEKPPTTFFGQEFEGGKFTEELARGVENAVLEGLSIAAAAITSGQDISVRELSSAVGSALGAAVGAYFGGPAGAQAGAVLGSVFGDFIGKQIEKFNGDTSGTKARKAVDKYFADLFSAERLTVIIGDELQQIEDFVLNAGVSGQTDGYATEGAIIAGAVSYGVLAPVGAAIGGQFGGKAPDSFATGTFDDQFAQQSAQVQSFFNSVGTSLEVLLGVSEEIAGQVAAILFNNIGGSLVNLQAVVAATGKTFEEFGDALFLAFFNGEIGIQQLQESLTRLRDIFQIGIPGEIGAIDQAVQNFNIALQDDKGSRQLFTSLQSIGQEAIEVGASLNDVGARIAQGLGLGAESVKLFLEAMKLAGINSVEELVTASNAQLATLAANILQITQGQAPTNTTVTPPENSITSTPNFKPIEVASAKASGISSAANNEAKRAEDERKRRLEQLRNETQRLITASDKYKDIMEALGDGTIRANDAGNELRKLYDGQFKILQRLEKAQEAYNKALERGVTGRNLSKLAKDLQDAQKAADTFSGKIEKAVRPDLSGLTALIRDMNTLGVVSKAVGVDAESLVGTLVQGFLRGNLSIKEVNDQIAQTKDLLGQGIPGAVGAVNDAFRNLQKGGTSGGVFSVDAFKDIFAEFEELFKQNAGPARKAQLDTLVNNFNAARDALQEGINSGKTPAEIAKLREGFDSASASLNNFRETQIVPELEDLRAQLRTTFSATDVETFFQAIESSGISTFDQFKTASEETVIGILGNLQSLGFSFAQTTDENTRAIINQFNEANNKLTEGKDPLGEQVKQIQSFLSGAQSLPPVFIEGAAAVGAFEGPLNKLNSDFDNILFKLTQFQQASYDKNILLNVSTNVSDSRTQSLLDLLFGNGSGSTPIPAGPGGNGSGLTPQERTEFERLGKLRSSGRLSDADRKRFKQLRAKRRGR